MSLHHFRPHHFHQFIFLIISISSLLFSLVSCDDDHLSATLSIVPRKGAKTSKGGDQVLQVAGDQLINYLRTLSSVPESVYNSAHIIADMDESSLSSTSTSGRYETSSDDDNQDGGRIPVVRLDHHQATASGPQYSNVEDSSEADAEVEPTPLSSNRRRRLLEESYEPLPVRRVSAYTTDYQRGTLHPAIRSLREYLKYSSASASDRDYAIRKEDKDKDLDQVKDAEAYINVKELKKSTTGDYSDDSSQSGDNYSNQENKDSSSSSDLKTLRELLNNLSKQIEAMQAASKKQQISSYSSISSTYGTSPSSSSYGGSSSLTLYRKPKEDRKKETADDLDLSDPYISSPPVAVVHAKKRYRSPIDVRTQKKEKYGTSKKPKLSGQKLLYMRPDEVMRVLAVSPDEEDQSRSLYPHPYASTMVRSRRYRDTSSNSGFSYQPYFPGGLQGIIGIPVPVYRPCPTNKRAERRSDLRTERMESLEDAYQPEDDLMTSQDHSTDKIMADYLSPLVSAILQQDTSYGRWNGK